MSDIIHARNVYETLCSALDHRGWRYQKEADDLVVMFGVNGDDLPMKFLIMIDSERQLIRLLSPLTFNFDDDKKVDAAIACCVASYKMAAGSFDCDLASGRVTFRMTSAFENSTVSEELFNYLIDCSCAMVEEYNDKFEAISKGDISISDFLSAEAQ